VFLKGQGWAGEVVCNRESECEEVDCPRAKKTCAVDC